MSRAVVAAALLAAAAAHAQQAEGGIEFSGYYKNILAVSDTVMPRERGYTVDLSRLRLQWKGQLAEGVAIDVQHDTELLLGDYLRTRQFALQKDLPPATYWKAHGNWLDSRSAYGQHRLHRGVLTLSRGATDLHLGRQRIAWGTGRFWSPMDVLNPFSPTALEPGERVGVDALRVERKLGAVSRVGAVWAPAHSPQRDTLLGLWHGNARGIDYSVAAGRRDRDRFLGLDLAGQIGDAGWRAEWTVTRPAGRASHQRALVGVDYAFANTVTLTGELFYDGAGSTDPARYDFAALLAGRMQNLARRYAGLYASYEITPLLKWTNALVWNLDDRSRYYSPRLVYSVRTNLDLTLGAQIYGGGPASEYGRMRDLWFAQVQWFF